MKQLTGLIITASLVLLFALPTEADVIYNEDFTNDPNFTFNVSSIYWDPGAQNLHCTVFSGVGNGQFGTGPAFDVVTVDSEYRVTFDVYVDDGDTWGVYPQLRLVDDSNGVPDWTTYDLRFQVHHDSPYGRRMLLLGRDGIAEWMSSYYWSPYTWYTVEIINDPQTGDIDVNIYHRQNGMLWDSGTISSDHNMLFNYVMVGFEGDVYGDDATALFDNILIETFTSPPLEPPWEPDEYTHGLWHFDEVPGVYIAHDASGHEYHMDMEDGAEFTTAGMFANAADLTDSDAKINSGWLIGNGWDALTIDAFIYPTEIGPPTGWFDEHSIISRCEHHNVDDVSYFFKLTANGGLSAGIYLNEPGTEEVSIVTDPGIIQENTWYHVAMSWSSGNQLKVFVNDMTMPIAMSPNAEEGTVRIGTDPLRIGCAWYWWYNEWEYFNGRIDEVRISNIDRYGEEPPPPPVWADDFEDGNYTADPEWEYVSGGVEVNMFEGDYALEMYGTNSGNTNAVIQAVVPAQEEFIMEFDVYRRDPSTSAQTVQMGFSEGGYIPNGGFKLMQHDCSTIETYWEATMQQSVPIASFDYRWQHVVMQRQPDGHWMIIWDQGGPNEAVIEGQDEFGEVEDLYFWLVCTPHYSWENGAYFDDFYMHPEGATPPTEIVDDFEDGDWTSNPTWTSVNGYGVNMDPNGHNNSDWCVELYESQTPNVYGVLSIPFAAEPEFMTQFWVKRRPDQNERNYFRAIISEGPYSSTGGFWLNYGHLQQHNTIFVWMDGEIIAEAPITFGDDWTQVKMIRTAEGAWDIFWDGALILENIQDTFGDIEDAHFSIEGQGYYNEGGILFDDVLITPEFLPLPTLVEHWDDGNWTADPEWFEYDNDNNFVINDEMGHLATPCLEVMAGLTATDYTALYTPANGGEAFHTSFWLHKRTETFSGGKIGFSEGGYSSSNTGFRIYFYQNNMNMNWYVNIYDVGAVLLGTYEMTWDPDRWINVIMERNDEGHWVIIWDHEGTYELMMEADDSFTSVDDLQFHCSPVGYYSNTGGFYLDDIVVTSSEPPPPPPLDLTLTPFSPPVIIPPDGGAVAYNISGTNNTSDTLYTELWITVDMPGGFSFVIEGPQDVYILGETTVERDWTIFVPPEAPPGEYLVTGMIGEYPWVIDEAESFPFIKEGEPGDQYSYTREGWRHDGEPFPNPADLITTVIPKTFALHGAFPNPFNPSTTIGFDLPEATRVVLTVYDIQGRRVAEVVNGWRQAGRHAATFDAAGLASGLYFYRIKAGDFSTVQKMVLVK